jgi:hypothetical protein
MFKEFTHTSGNVSIVDGEIVASKETLCKKSTTKLLINVANSATKIQSAKHSLGGAGVI